MEMVQVAERTRTATAATNSTLAGWLEALPVFLHEKAYWTYTDSVSTVSAYR